jgi:hypothetical protein
VASGSWSTVKSTWATVSCVTASTSMEGSGSNWAACSGPLCFCHVDPRDATTGSSSRRELIGLFGRGTESPSCHQL